MNRRHLLATLAATATLPAIQARGQTLTKASLRLKWLPQTQFAGFYLAKARGYYAAEGIDLAINPGGPNLLTENLVATGADTFGLSGGTDSVFAARDKGLPVVCVGIAHQVTPFVFVARADGPVKALTDFRGKTVTTWFTGANYVLLGMLAQAGIKQSELTLQPQQVSMTPFIDGQSDVATATVYNEYYTLMTRMGARQAAPLRARGLRRDLPARHRHRQRGDGEGQAGAGARLPARLHPRLARGAARPEGRRGHGDGGRPHAGPRGAGVHADGGRQADGGGQAAPRTGCCGSTGTR